MSELVNVDRAADRVQTVKGNLSMSRLPRLGAVHDAHCGALAAGDEFVAGSAVDGATFELHFSRDAQGRAVVTGAIAARVAATCQRCMQPMWQQLSSTVDAVLLPAGTQPTRALESVDWIEFEREALNIAAFCDEELLLALPVITRHDDDDEACVPD